VRVFKKIRDSLVYRARSAYCKISLYFWQAVTNVIISNKRNLSRKDVLIVHTMVWGDKYIDWFFDYSLPSIMQSGNLPAIEGKDIVFYIYTKECDIHILDKRMKGNLYNYKIYSEDEFSDNARDMVINFIINTLEDGVKKNAMILWMPPDCIYSDRSVYNLVTLSDRKGVSIAVPHARVSSSCVRDSGIINNFLDSKVDSSLLMDLTLQCMHASLRFADETLNNNTTDGGIATRKLDKNNLAVIHNIPSVQLYSPTNDDISFYKKRVTFSDNDHVWPHMLYRQSRLKVVGSSDIAFLVELTDDDDKTPDLTKDMRYNDEISIHNKPFCNYSNVIIHSWRSDKE